MPEIPLLDREGKPLGALESYFTLQAIMYSPKDKDCVAPYLSLTREGLTELCKKTFLRLSKSGIGGTVAGQVFYRLLQLKIHRPEDASIGKAVFLISTALKKKSLADRIRIPTGRGYVQDLWIEFRPAGHLWGAALLLSQIGIEPKKGDPWPYTKDLIHVADYMFEAAVATKLNLGCDPWKLPKSYPRKSLKIKLDPPETEIVELLGKYTASDRRS